MDDLFAWENTLDATALAEDNQHLLSGHQRQLLAELSELEWRVKEGRAELDKIHNYKTKAASKFSTARSKADLEDPHQDYLKMLMVQASSIEHLI